MKSLLLGSVGIVAVVVTLPIVPMRAQSDAKPLAFEVASIKRVVQDASPERSSAGMQAGGRFVMTNGPIRVLIDMAYRRASSELVGAPDWLTRENYDVTAVAGRSVSDDELSAMLQDLLKERFKFVAHFEDVERPAYELRLDADNGRVGPQIRKSNVDCDARMAAVRAGTAPPLQPPAPTGPVGPCTTRHAPGALVSGGNSMAVLAVNLSGMVGRPVVDQTGLTGDYEFNLQYSPNDLQNSASSADSGSDTPSLFTALREQLGLRLQPVRSQTRVLVIDHVEKPTED